MTRLTGLSMEEIRADPLERGRDLADRTGAVVLLKGAPSVVAAPGEPVRVDTVGSSDLASAGMGDHLGGVAVAFLAAGAAPADAAALALFYSGRAAELAGRGRALTPDDVSDHLDRAFRAPGPAASDLGLPFVLFDQPARW
jgi:NAD(P)H-hydrate epimerase